MSLLGAMLYFLTDSSESVLLNSEEYPDYFTGTFDVLGEGILASLSDL